MKEPRAVQEPVTASWAGYPAGKELQFLGSPLQKFLADIVETLFHFIKGHIGMRKPVLLSLLQLRLTDTGTNDGPPRRALVLDFSYFYPYVSCKFRFFVLFDTADLNSPKSLNSCATSIQKHGYQKVHQSDFHRSSLPDQL